MNKRTVIHGLVMVVSAVALSGCTVLHVVRQSHPPVPVQTAIGADVADALAKSWSRNPTAFFVQPLRDFPALHTTFIDGLRNEGIAVTNSVGDAANVDLAVVAPNPNTVHVNVAIDGVLVIDRMYRATRAVAANAHAYVRPQPKQNTIGSKSTQQPASSPSEVNVAQTERQPDIPTPATVPAPVEITHPRPDAISAQIAKSINISPPQQPTHVDCGAMSLRPGSLKRNVIRILQQCGWTLTGWPADPAHADHELDWVVPVPRSLEATTLEAFVALLERTFRFNVALDRKSHTAVISVRH